MTAKPSESQGQPSPGEAEQVVAGPPVASAGAGGSDDTPAGGLDVGHGAALGPGGAPAGQPVSSFPPAQAWGPSDWRPSTAPAGPPAGAGPQGPAGSPGQPVPPPLGGAPGAGPGWGAAAAG
ncbi:MAG: hypothetical protein ABSE77_10065, partial [Acidimicrobiales bacterium]